MRRARRIAKWTGLTLALLIAAAWTVSLRSGWWGPGHYKVYSNKGYRVVGLGSGSLGYESYFPNSSTALRASGWAWNCWGSTRIKWLPRVQSAAESLNVSVPFWIPFLLFGIPTAWLFWTDRRARAGHCRCGYDLAGLPPDAVCPECGRGPKP